MHTDFSLSPVAIDTHALRAQLDAPDCGAIAVFEGVVRNHNNAQAVTHLSYSAYATMAVKQGNQILREVAATYSIKRALCVHRTGDLSIGDVAIYIGVASHHRDAAFDACRVILERVKADVPIWKHEFYAGDQPSAWLSNNG